MIKYIIKYIIEYIIKGIIGGSIYCMNEEAESADITVYVY